jgi:hypothetical protein
LSKSSLWKIFLVCVHRNYTKCFICMYLLFTLKCHLLSQQTIKIKMKLSRFPSLLLLISFVLLLFEIRAVPNLVAVRESLNPSHPCQVVKKCKTGVYLFEWVDCFVLLCTRTPESLGLSYYIRCAIGFASP